MLAVIGLGNPGSEYHGTRHNVGFAVVDSLAHALGISFEAGRGEYLSGIQGTRVLLVKPLTYMNNSGIAVREVMERFPIGINDLLVVADDFHIPLGTLRLRMKGSAGGHNGLSSVIWHLNSDQFPRLRCGIGSAQREEGGRRSADFVLSLFEQEEQILAEKMIRRACEIARIAVEEDLSTAMRRLSNKK